MRLILTLILLAFSSAIFADELKTFQWKPPTQYTDGTDLPASSIKGFNIYCNGALFYEVSGDVDIFQVMMVTGDYACYVTTKAEIESEPSDNVEFPVAGQPQVKPMPIESFRVY